MGRWKAFQANLCVFFPVLFSVLIFTPLCFTQTKSAASNDAAAAAALSEFNKYPGLLPESGRLVEKLQRGVKFPPERNHSNLLPLLPDSTIAYIAIPNYGEAAHQALNIFRQELNDSTDLRAWWTHGDMLTIGPKIEDSLDKFSQLSEYIGDEIVMFGALDGRDTNMLVFAQVHKPGLKSVLQSTVTTLARNSKASIRIVDPQELVSIKETRPQELVVLVRPDYVVASTNLVALRSFNARLDQGTRGFLGNAFAQRILQAYANGATVIGALDLQKIVTLVPHDPGFAMFERTGFADVKYAVWDHRFVNGRRISQAELSFLGPRHGIASWLAAPVPLDSLEFVSSKAIFVTSIVLNDPPKMLDDIQQLSASNPNALAFVAQMEQALGISLRDDVLAQLGGEVTIEIDSVNATDAAWKAIIRVKDVERFQKTLNTMLTGAHLPTEEFNQSGVGYRVVRIPAGKGSNAVAFAFEHGYWIIASSADTLTEALHLRQNGESLGKSRRFLAALPPGHSGASALLYQDPTSMMAMRLQQFLPGLAQSMSQAAPATNPAVIAFYGEKDAIREASTNPGVDAGVVLVGAAIAIPNLLRSRMAANEAAAVGMTRTLNTAQITYYTTYPDRGFAPDLATLGPGARVPSNPSAFHAALIDDTLGNPTCTAGQWCIRSGYRFTMKAMCAFGACREFAAVATPVSRNTGTRSFCSTSDGVIRFQVGAPLTDALSPKECKAWPPLR